MRPWNALTLALLGLAACGGKEGTLTVGTDTGSGDTGTVEVGDTGPGDTGSTATTGDTTTVECNTANEDCGPGTCGGEGATMLPGADCLACHTRGNMPGGEDEPSKWYDAAGTVFTDLAGSAPASGVIVRVTDATGKTVEMTTNSVGNFYTTSSLVPPLSAEVEVGGAVRSMATQPETGACNSCHRCDGPAGGKLYAP